MLTVIFFYFFLLVFWLENVMGLKISNIHGLSLLNIALYALLVVWAINIIKKRKIFNSGKLNGYLIILFFIVAFSIPVKYILNELPHDSLTQELIYLKAWLNPVILFFVLYNTLDNDKNCKLILNGLIFFFIVTVISTIGEATGIIQIGKLKIVQESRSAGFAEPNQYAAYLVLFLPLFFSITLFSSGWKKIYSITIICLACISILITGSRGGIISLIFTIITYLYIFTSQKLLRIKKLLLIFIIGIPVLGTSAFFLTPANVRHNVIERFNPNMTSNTYKFTSGRTVLWKNSFELFLESPFWGHGQETIIPLMKKKFPIWGNSHNDYLLYLVEYGIIGLAAFLLILFSLFKESWINSLFCNDKWIQILSLSYFAGLSGFALAMFGVNIIKPRFLFWAYSAVILRLGHLHYTHIKKLP